MHTFNMQHTSQQASTNRFSRRSACPVRARSRKVPSATTGRAPRRRRKLSCSAIRGTQIAPYLPANTSSGLRNHENCQCSPRPPSLRRPKAAYTTSQATKAPTLSTNLHPKSPNHAQAPPHLKEKRRTSQNQTPAAVPSTCATPCKAHHRRRQL